MSSNEGEDCCYTCRRELERCLDVYRSLTRLLGMYSSHPLNRIMSFLCTIESSASIRRISRNVGLTHKNTARYLELLLRAGLVEVSYKTVNLKLYEPSDIGRKLKVFFERSWHG